MVALCVCLALTEVIRMRSATEEFEQLEEAASDAGVSQEVYLQSLTLDILREIRDLLKSQKIAE